MNSLGMQQYIDFSILLDARCCDKAGIGAEIHLLSLKWKVPWCHGHHSEMVWRLREGWRTRCHERKSQMSLAHNVILQAFLKVLLTRGIQNFCRRFVNVWSLPQLALSTWILRRICCTNSCLGSKIGDLVLNGIKAFCNLDWLRSIPFVASQERFVVLWF